MNRLKLIARNGEVYEGEVACRENQSIVKIVLDKPYRGHRNVFVNHKDGELNHRKLESGELKMDAVSLSHMQADCILAKFRSRRSQGLRPRKPVSQEMTQNASV